MHSGNFVLTLHSHLPMVMHHGNSPHGEDWLYEAAAECYIPLLNVFNDLLHEGITPKVTIGLTPILCEQLEHAEFTKKFSKYCESKTKAARLDEQDFNIWGYDPHQVYLTQYWQQFYLDRKYDFLNKYDGSIVKAFKKLQDLGAIEVMTSAATHGYLPMLATENSINLQIKTAVENYKKHFERPPRGIWLPECAYRPSYEWHSMIPVEPFHHKKLRPGIEQFLNKHKLDYFMIDESLTKRAKPIGAFLDAKKEKFISVDSPSFQPMPHGFDKSPLNLFHVSSSEKTEYGTAIAFTRHHDIAMQVWSGEVGYPGEPDYLDFHKKHLASGLRYWRVTDNKADMMYKTLYHPDWTVDKVDKQANHFIHHIENTVNHYKKETNKTATLCTPFDTELFGHWWFEGPEFIRAVIKGIHHSPYINSVTASEQIYYVKPTEVMSIPEGSWGENNNHDVWSNEGNKWIWEAIYNDENRMSEVLTEYRKVESNYLLTRIMQQLVRELLLLQASDWPFLIYTQSAKDYAEQRFIFHHSDFNKLASMALESMDGMSPSRNEMRFLQETEKRNSVFGEIDVSWWEDNF